MGISHLINQIKAQRMTQEGPRIVLVENDSVLAEITKFRLELTGYQVTLYQAASEALSLIKDSPPALVIVDLRLPDGKGFELIEALGLDEATASVPVMVMSTDAELDTVQKAYRAGAVDYLVIPYDPLVLQGKVDNVLQRSPVAR